MPGYYKVGYSTTSIEQRMKELYKTGVPIPFKCEFYIRSNNARKTE